VSAAPAAATERLIFALDVDDVEEAARLVGTLAGTVGMVKIGKQLFVRGGPDIVRRVHAAGAAVFLDLKFHDIPRTVALAAIEAARLGVRMFDVHASGGATMMRTTADEVGRACGEAGAALPMIVAVTVLTSLENADLRQVGIASGVARQVDRLARLAADSGMTGVVASPHEVRRIRRACGPEFVIVTPGVRPAAAGWDDQKRVGTPAAAIRAGADYLVVGRPIRDAPSPRDAARAIVDEMTAAFATR
jgi:orotidine-5'-phosphate decarboxylase